MISENVDIDFSVSFWWQFTKVASLWTWKEEKNLIHEECNALWKTKTDQTLHFWLELPWMLLFWTKKGITFKTLLNLHLKCHSFWASLLRYTRKWCLILNKRWEFAHFSSESLVFCEQKCELLSKNERCAISLMMTFL